jgi:hypothetical protein
MMAKTPAVGAPIKKTLLNAFVVASVYGSFIPGRKVSEEGYRQANGECIDRWGNGIPKVSRMTALGMAYNVGDKVEPALAQARVYKGAVPPVVINRSELIFRQHTSTSLR